MQKQLNKVVKRVFPPFSSLTSTVVPLWLKIYFFLVSYGFDHVDIQAEYKYGTYIALCSAARLDIVFG